MPTYLSPGVYVEEVESGSRPIEGVGTAVGAFIGATQKGPLNQPTLVTNWTQYSQIFGDFVEGSYMGHAVYGYLNNGGGAAYIVRVGGDGNGAGPTARAELPAGTKPGVGAYQILAVGPGEAAPITVDVEAPPDAPETSFKLVVKVGDEVRETFDGLTTKKGKQNAATVVNAQSKLIQLEEVENASLEKRPQTGSFTLEAITPPAETKPAVVRADDYVGDSADRTGFGGLEEVDAVTMISVPDVMAAYRAGMIDLEGVQAVQLGMIAHCELMGDRMAILDAPPGLNAQQVLEWRVSKAGYDSRFAALYWPWIKVFDPATGQNIFVPPSGHMAGIWSRNDATRGVHKAPANEVVRGAITLETNTTPREHDQLNPVGINVVRSFPGRGVRVWGARTLSSDANWRYINVRRLFNYVEESVFEGTQWVVFEPNDMDLWQRIRRTITAFLLRTWREGALFGATADQAFYVKCDSETNPPEVIDAGQVVCEIGIAPVKPAEFVIFRIAQYAGGAAISE
jgi:phage tail sheath protein FI